MAKDYSKLKVVELKAELKRLGLPQNGLKAELVARLEHAEDGNQSDPEDAPEATEQEVAPTEPVSKEESHSEAEVLETVTEAAGTEAAAKEKPLPKDTSPVEPTTEAATATAITPVQEMEVANSDQQPPLDVTPLRPTEIQQDAQKRKRRSTSPPPAEDSARKRARHDDVQNKGDAALTSMVAEAEETRQLQTEQLGSMDIDVEGVAFKESDVSEVSKFESFPHGNQTESEPLDQNKQDAQSLNGDAVDLAQEQQQEQDLDVEPSVHPATSALYIKNFMRPLRSQAVQDHLLDLATPAGCDLDSNIISNFYLDTIRTHAFVIFDSVSAASRVRSSLHNRVWPDETNRKALWVDFIPPEMFDTWVDTEQGSSGGRGSTNRYEVMYEDDVDGNVKARLEESGAGSSATRPPPSPPQPDRKPTSIPTGPSRGVSGIEGAPLGPRGFQHRTSRSQIHPSRLDRIVDRVDQVQDHDHNRNNSYQMTETYPVVNWKPVAEELAGRRLSALRTANAPNYDDRETNKEYKRYFFENGDSLVDRGPEIFLGIRPPHRERERRREQHQQQQQQPRPQQPMPISMPPQPQPPQQQHGRRRHRGRRDRRHPVPMPHGVPRGGDRYRGPASSAYDDRPRYNDEPPRYDDDRSRHGDDRYDRAASGSGGGGRFRRDSYSRY